VAEAAACELHAMRDWLGLDKITVGARGDLGPSLRRAIKAC
jgi:uncharacterized protein YcaQ